MMLNARAQGGLCPSNLDFETGDFSGWICRAGVTANNPLPITGPIPGRHTIISAATAGLDPFGFFPEISPLGSAYSVKLGNHQTQAQAESISYTYAIPSNLSVFSMLIYYAVVIESPGHTPANQPRFQARIIDVATGLPIPCVDFDFIAQTTPGGFQTSPIPGNLGSPVLYKDWTPISINLNAYIGRTIMLEFVTKDCSQNGHAGYAYIDVGTSCNGAITGNYVCPNDPGITLTAPFGFQGYTWYSDATFSTILSNSQTLPLFPPPPFGTVFPVIVDPFPGFGCRDTLYATVEVGVPPVSNAGPDQSICKNIPVQIGGPPQPGYTYSWVPSAEVSNPNISNPFAQPATTNPTEFIVTTTDILNGCTSGDTVIVSTFFTDTTLTVTGNLDFCAGETGPVLDVSNTSTAVQWHETSTGPIPGATGTSYQPLVAGTYWAQVTQGGCLDSTRNILIAQHPLPQAAFTASADSGCVAITSFNFANGSSSPDNATLTHLWRFSDGGTDINTDAVKTFGSTGIYTVKLITTTSFGCKDSTQQIVQVFPNGVPDFTWDSVCTGRPVQFTNRSNENGSPQVWYGWDFNNGDPQYTVRNPPPVIYNTQPGKLDVILKMTTLGCESDTQTVRKTIQVNRQAPGHRYRDITVPQGSSHYLHVRDSIGEAFNWRPPMHLSSYNSRYTEFFANGNDVLYYIDITDRHTCVTVDTIQMLVLKKPGFYLPTAFTPNNDGLNDLARPYLIGMNGLKSFSIFNRTGQLIYYTQTYGQGWDGKYRGVDQPSGVFVWVLEFFDSNNKLVLEKGTITLIR